MVAREYNNTHYLEENFYDKITEVKTNVTTGLPQEKEKTGRARRPRDRSMRRSRIGSVMNSMDSEDQGSKFPVINLQNFSEDASQSVSKRKNFGSGIGNDDAVLEQDSEQNLDKGTSGFTAMSRKVTMRMRGKQASVSISKDKAARADRDSSISPFGKRTQQKQKAVFEAISVMNTLKAYSSKNASPKVANDQLPPVTTDDPGANQKDKHVSPKKSMFMSFKPKSKIKLQNAN